MQALRGNSVFSDENVDFSAQETFWRVYFGACAVFGYYFLVNCFYIVCQVQFFVLHGYPSHFCLIHMNTYLNISVLHHNNIYKYVLSLCVYVEAS